MRMHCVFSHLPFSSTDFWSLSSRFFFVPQFYGQASRAFIKLEALDGAAAAELDKYQELAIRIFGTRWLSQVFEYTI